MVCRDRDQQGNYLGSSSLVIAGVDDPVILETIACREALALAEDLNLNNLIIASDAKQVVSDISKSRMGRNATIIHEIRSRASSFVCNFIFEGRAANRDAHNLVKYSLSLGPGRHVCLGQPQARLVSHDLWTLMNKLTLPTQKNHYLNNK